MHRLPLAVNRVSAAGGACKFQLVVVHINADRTRAARTRSSYGAQTHSATTHNCDSVAGGDPSTRHCVKSDCQGFNQAQFLRCEFCRIQLFWRHHDEFCESTVPLHSESLVELAGVRTSSP